MANSIKQYGQVLQLAGGNLVYISNKIYPTFTDNGFIINPEQYYIDLKNAVNVAQTSVHCLENTNPPSFLNIEHRQLVSSFQGILNCLNNVFNTQRTEQFFEINETELEKDFSSLKRIQEDLNQTTLKVMEKIRLQSSR